jgi:hypothetical protein
LTERITRLSLNNTILFKCVTKAPLIEVAETSSQENLSHRIKHQPNSARRPTGTNIPIAQQQAGMRTLVRHSRARSHRQVRLGYTGLVAGAPFGDVLSRSGCLPVGPYRGPFVERPWWETAG